MREKGWLRPLIKTHSVNYIYRAPFFSYSKHTGFAVMGQLTIGYLIKKVNKTARFILHKKCIFSAHLPPLHIAVLTSLRPIQVSEGLCTTVIKIHRLAEYLSPLCRLQYPLYKQKQIKLTKPTNQTNHTHTKPNL